MNLETVTEIISEQELNEAWGNADFGNDRNAIDKHKLVANGVLKLACGYVTGHTMMCILFDLGLIRKSCELTFKGRQYLYSAFNSGISV